MAHEIAFFYAAAQHIIAGASPTNAIVTAYSAPPPPPTYDPSAANAGVNPNAIAPTMQPMNPRWDIDIAIEGTKTTVGNALYELRQFLNKGQLSGKNVATGPHLYVTYAPDGLTTIAYRVAKATIHIDSDSQRHHGEDTGVTIATISLELYPEAPLETAVQELGTVVTADTTRINLGWLTSLATASGSALAIAGDIRFVQNNDDAPGNPLNMRFAGNANTYASTGMQHLWMGFQPALADGSDFRAHWKARDGAWTVGGPYAYSTGGVGWGEYITHTVTNNSGNYGYLWHINHSDLVGSPADAHTMAGDFFAILAAGLQVKTGSNIDFRIRLGYSPDTVAANASYPGTDRNQYTPPVYLQVPTGGTRHVIPLGVITLDTSQIANLDATLVNYNPGFVLEANALTAGDEFYLTSYYLVLIPYTHFMHISSTNIHHDAEVEPYLNVITLPGDQPFIIAVGNAKTWMAGGKIEEVRNWHIPDYGAEFVAFWSHYSSVWPDWGYWNEGHELAWGLQYLKGIAGPPRS